VTVRIFLDANLLFSAAKSDGAVRSMFDRLLQSGHELWANDHVVTEARENLSLKCPARVPGFENLVPLLRLARVIPSGDALPEAAAPLHAKDRPVLAAAIAARCAILVTGDRTHFGFLFGQTVGGVAICSPAMLADRLLQP
jgi:predicted nucleic acid-binding protein